MKMGLMISAALWVAISGAAGATVLSPPNTHFTVRGHVKVLLDGKDARCLLTMKGATNDRGVGEIRSFQLAGTSDACSVTPTGLPWTVKGYGRTAAAIYGFSYQNPVMTCKTEGIIVSVSSDGTWTFQGSLSCINGAISTNPPITVVPNKTIAIGLRPGSLP